MIKFRKNGGFRVFVLTLRDGPDPDWSYWKHEDCECVVEARMVKLRRAGGVPVNTENTEGTEFQGEAQGLQQDARQAWRQEWL